MDPQIAIIIASITTGIAALITSVASLVVQLRTSNNLRIVHTTINSRMDELLRVSTSAAHAEGVIEGSSSKGV